MTGGCIAQGRVRSSPPVPESFRRQLSELALVVLGVEDFYAAHAERMRERVGKVAGSS